MPRWSPRGRAADRAVAVSARDAARPRHVADGLRWHGDPVRLAADPSVDVVVEAMGGSEGPARALVEAALLAGKPVVTANKALLATHGAALAALAERHGVPLAYEAAVAGGIPAIKALREGLAANRISRVAGILNGTCNYILTEMRLKGLPFADVLAEAQALGYAEADPSFDIDGVDAAHKLAILAALAFGRPVEPRRASHRGHPAGVGARHRAGGGAGLPHQAPWHRQPRAGRRRRQGASLHGAAGSPLAAVEGVFNAVLPRATRWGGWSCKDAAPGRGRPPAPSWPT
jgi:homoserine dehydrogenase